jgi:hypothetical protein
VKMLRIVLYVAGALVAAFVIHLVVTMARAGQDVRHVDAVAERFHPGMTIDQIVAVFPTDFLSVTLAVSMRTKPCKTEAGEILPPEHYPVLFPDMPQGDSEANELSWQARQLPLTLETMEPLDKHLREHADWRILAQAWSAYLEDAKDPSPVPYLRRGTAYLALDDFNLAYPDLEKSCELGSKDACAAVKKLPPEKTAAFDAEEQRTISTAPPCEPDLHWYSVAGPIQHEYFQVQVKGPGKSQQSGTVTLSRQQLAALLAREFKGRQWGIKFLFAPPGFVHYSFYLALNRDGKLESVTPVHAFD